MWCVTGKKLKVISGSLVIIKIKNTFLTLIMSESTLMYLKLRKLQKKLNSNFLQVKKTALLLPSIFTSTSLH